VWPARDHKDVHAVRGCKSLPSRDATIILELALVNILAFLTLTFSIRQMHIHFPAIPEMAKGLLQDNVWII